MIKNSLTKEDLIEQIKKVGYVRVGAKTMICTLTLKNGFEVVGTSACIDVKNFDETIGKECAYEKAVEQLWQLEGYRLQTKLSHAPKQGVALLKPFECGTEFDRLIALRSNLQDNIQLADNKAFGLLKIKPDSDTLKSMCLDVIDPNIKAPNAPENYEIFNTTNLEDIRYECRILREIVIYKYAAVKKMVKFIRG